MDKATYRNDPLFLRNNFDAEGRWNFPIIKKQELQVDDTIELIAFSDTSKGDTKNLHKGVHFFIDDPRFESIYNQPERSLEKLSRYRFLLTPDYSLFAEMPLWRQIESVGKSRWCGAYWQANGLTVIPTASWGLYQTYDFCFDGIERGSIVAVGTIGCKHNKNRFMRGYNTMLEHINPRSIICLGTPFPEMGNNTTVVNYMDSRRTVR